MSFLVREVNHLSQEFEGEWTCWQEQQGWTHCITWQDIDLTLYHFSANLYEYFPQVSLRAMRLIGIVSCAASTYAYLLQREVAGTLPSDQASVAYNWLKTFAHEKLSQIIPESASFWQQIAVSYHQCREAFELEHKCISLLKTYSSEHFYKIVSGKITLANVTATAFAYLSDRQELLGQLVESQFHLYAGLQLYQDVLNWKQDFVSGKLSYLLANLLTKVPSCTSAGSPIARQAQLSKVGRYFYYTGFADQTLQAASEHFCRAMAAVTDLVPTSWGAMLAMLMEKSEQLRKDLEQIRRQQIAKAYERLNKSPVAARSTSVSVSCSEINKAVDAAASYLAEEQATDGRWGDFMLLAEQSTFWVTGYVGWTLGQTRVGCADLGQAARWLLDNQFLGGGWGYNSHWPEDADSIANALLFLSDREEIEPDDWAPAMIVLLNHQRADGGFTTIVDAEAWLSRFRSDADDLSGWTCSHPCVTAVIALLLAKISNGYYRAQAAKAIEYLCGCQQPEGYWNAYWWTGQFYTTCRAVQAMHAMGESSSAPHLVRAGVWLTTKQSHNGSWTTSDNGDGQSFHTALAVQALCTLEKDSAYSNALNRGVRWLLDHQLSDGSWPEVPILRVPTPDTLCPWERDTWRESIFGLNVVVPDWRRLFTTATVLQALHAVIGQSVIKDK